MRCFHVRESNVPKQVDRVVPEVLDEDGDQLHPRLDLPRHELALEDAPIRVLDKHDGDARTVSHQTVIPTLSTASPTPTDR